jgi:glutamate transport system permease protein
MPTKGLSRRLLLTGGAGAAAVAGLGWASSRRGGEAGRAQVVWLVLLPQVVRAMLPAIVSQVVVLLKDTALGFLITYRELLTEARQLASSARFEFPTIPLALVVAAVYITVCLLLSALGIRLEARYGRVRTRLADGMEQGAAGAR